MGLTRNLAAYEHVRSVLEKALAHDELTYTLATPKEAIRWRQEAYYYRKLIAETGNQKFANFVISIEGPAVIIRKRLVTGTITTQDGTRVDPAPRPIEEDADETEAFALDFAKRLGLDIEGDD